MGTMLLAYDNLIGPSTTLSGGSWRTTLPLANMKIRTQGLVARSQDLTSTSTMFMVDLGSEGLFRTVSLINHNFGLDALIRIQASEGAPDGSNEFAEVTWDSGWVDAWPAVFSSLDLAWEADNFWGGQYTDRSRQGYNWTAVVSAPGTRNARYFRIDISDATNAEGYVQVGRLFIGDAWQPDVNFTYGVGIGWEDPSEIETSLSGAEFFSERTKYRTALFSTDWMSQDEALSFAFEIKRRVGTAGEVIFQYDPDDTTHKLRRQFCGRLRTLDQITHPNFVQYATGWEVKELL